MFYHYFCCFLWIPKYTYEPDHEKMCLMSYANNKGADQPAHSAQSDQRLCCSLLRWYNISRFYSRNFKTVSSFCGCTGLFVSGLVGNSRRHDLSCRGSYNKKHIHFNRFRCYHTRCDNRHRLLSCWFQLDYWFFWISQSDTASHEFWISENKPSLFFLKINILIFSYLLITILWNQSVMK